MASKQQMARELVALGCGKSLNTLRQYPVDKLESMLAAAKEQGNTSETTANEPANKPETTVQEPIPEAIPYASVAPEIPHLPLVPEGYGAIRVPVPAPAQQPSSFARALGLLFGPIAILRFIVGI